MIYFMRAGGTDYVKIGYTRDETTLQSRLLTLQTGQPWRLEILRVIEDADQWVEAVLHEFFAPQRHHGEWFTYSSDMMLVFMRGDKAAVKRHLTGKSRKYLESLIQNLVDILDTWTPDVDAELDDDPEPDDEREDGGDEYFEIPVGFRLPGVFGVLEDCDYEATRVEVEEFAC